MSDYRNSNFDNGNDNANDPLQRSAPDDPNARAMNATWGWVAAAVFIVVVLAVAFGFGHRPGGSTNTAYNDVNPPAATHTAPPVTPAPSATPTTPSFAPAPMTPTPNSAPSAPQGGGANQ